MPKLSEYLTIKDAAEFLAVSQNTLRNWEASGKIAVHRNPMNGYRLFKTQDLQNLLEEIEKSAAPANPKSRRPRQAK
ncbi:MAG: MerR family DNA-binding transcriptional regulator [Candidatus Nealsonbacteria bacterium]|nr:MerR family DNA-binding transcriptional regulator [Candidatus Nealsonbacteria bacterium]